MEYFASEKMKQRVGDYLLKLKTLHTEDEFSQRKVEFILPVIESFYTSPEKWDPFTKLNIEYVAEIFFNDLGTRPSDTNDFDMVICSCFRFCVERQLKSANVLPKDITKFKEFCIDRRDDFTTTCREQINYSLHDMPIAIINSILTGSEMEVLNKIPALLTEAEKLTNAWSKEITDKTKVVTDLQDKLERQKNAFNFVGLYDGFNQLSEIKKKEMNWAKAILFSLGLAILAPIIYEIYSLTTIEGLSLESSTQIIKFVPVASLTLILIYFFRVSLSNFHSIRSQIVQIELRKTLCAFIQHYVDFAKEKKSGDAEILKKFEEIVFTNIMTTEDKVPSTFDGLEQISSMIGAFKGGK